MDRVLIYHIVTRKPSGTEHHGTNLTPDGAQLVADQINLFREPAAGERLAEVLPLMHDVPAAPRDLARLN